MPRESFNEVHLVIEFIFRIGLHSGYVFLGRLIELLRAHVEVADEQTTIRKRFRMIENSAHLRFGLRVTAGLQQVVAERHSPGEGERAHPACRGGPLEEAQEGEGVERHQRDPCRGPARQSQA